MTGAVLILRKAQGFPAFAQVVNAIHFEDVVVLIEFQLFLAVDTQLQVAGFERVTGSGRCGRF